MSEHPCGDYPAPCNCDNPVTHDVQTAEHGIDTGTTALMEFHGICRLRETGEEPLSHDCPPTLHCFSCHTHWPCDARVLADALDRQREETTRLRAEAEKAEAEIRELRESHHPTHRDYMSVVQQRDDARARLAEIRALCDERDGCVTEHTRFLIREIRAVLDR